jgi:hypothetical protein
MPYPARMESAAAPQQRVDALLSALYRLSLDDLTRLSPPSGDQPDRAAARERALAAAQEAGLMEAVGAATGAASELAIRAFALHQFEPTWAGLQWSRSLGTARDRGNLIAPVEDAALVTVVADRLADDDRALLVEPFESILAMRATYPDLSLPRALSARGRLAVIALAALFGIELIVALGSGSPVLAIGAALVIFLVLMRLTRWRPNRA